MSGDLGIHGLAMDKEILCEADNGIAWLRFNRPDKKNAITAAMYGALADGLQVAAADPSVRVIVLCGSAGVFTAGNDLEDFLHHPVQGDDSPVLRFMRALRDMPKPVIAGVDGMAIGIGTTLLMHCDLVYASDRARFAMPFVQLGLCAEFASSLLLTQLAGYHRAAEMLLTGDAFPVEVAVDAGLVNRQVSDQPLDDFLRAQATRLAALPSDALCTTKRLMRAAQRSTVEVVMQEELTEFTRLLSGPDAKEAFEAFLQKRRPQFQ